MIVLISPDNDVLSKMIKLGCGEWQCTECGYSSRCGNVKKHIESKHVIKEYHCIPCDKILFGMNAFYKHKQYYHK